MMNSENKSQYDNRLMTSRSKYYNYFDVEEGKAICKNCGVLFPYSSRIGTNSLRNHIRSKHPEIFQQLDAWQPNTSTQQNDINQNDFKNTDLLDIKPNVLQLGSIEEDNSMPPEQKSAKKRRATPNYSSSSYNPNFQLDLRALGIPTSSSIDQSMHHHNESIYPQALLEAMAGTDSSVQEQSVDQSARHDVETIAQNLSSCEDALFYLKTTSEIIRKWPPLKVRIFVQNLLKQAMDEDNKMRFATE